MRKALHNPIVVVALAVVAVGVLVWTILAPQVRRKGGRSARSTALATAPAVALPAPTEPAPTNAVPGVPARALDRDAILAQLPRWIESPVRDPFFLLAASTTSSSAFTNKASDVLRLTAIWRQTGGQLAVINNHIVREGESVADFRIQRIDSEAVWVYRANQEEKLDFGSIGGTQAPR